MTDSDPDRAPTASIGLILAAGFGSRLETATGPSRLKPLLQVRGEPLILRAIRGLERAGCARVVIVRGFAGDELEAEITRLHRGPAALEFVDNPDYQRANGLSVLAAKARLDSTFILMMADHLVGASVMALAAEHRPPAGGATLLVDRKIDQVFDLDDATKVQTDGNRIVNISKQLTEYDCIDTGVFVCTPGLVDAIGAVADEKGDASLSEGVARLAASDRMEVLDVGDGTWMDVDTPEMLADAEARLEPG